MLKINDNWQREGLCNRGSPNLFFPPIDFEPSVQRRKRETKAKTICTSCAVKAECLEHALKHEELQGVWGGTNEKERKRQRILNQVFS